MATASTPYFERQWILNVSHCELVTGHATRCPSTSSSCAKSFGRDLAIVRTCRAKLALRSTSERIGSIVRPGRLATVDDALGEGAPGGSSAARATSQAAYSRVGAQRGHRAASQGVVVPTAASMRRCERRQAPFSVEITCISTCKWLLRGPPWGLFVSSRCD